MRNVKAGILDVVFPPGTRYASAKTIEEAILCFLSDEEFRTRIFQ
jgi:hypothetical protein